MSILRVFHMICSPMSQNSFLESLPTLQPLNNMGPKNVLAKLLILISRYISQPLLGTYALFQ